MLFLGVDEILEMHNYLLERFGGLEGIRDKGLLESAVMHPQMVFYWE